MRSFKVVYVDSRGNPCATVCSYPEHLANDLADEMEDKGTEILDVVECKNGTPPSKIERMYQ